MIEIRSETAAVVWLVKVAVGERIQAGATVAILESMKVEIPVTAPADGTVVELRVEPDAPVEPGDVIAVIDPS